MDTELSVTPKNDIIVASFRLHENGLEPIGEPSFEQWESCGDFIHRSQKAMHFWLGDWVNYGERKWGERYKEVLEKTRYDYQTLRNDKWISSRVPSERRRPDLSFDHHQTVADLPAEEQDELLSTAEEKHLNNETFRKLVKDRELSPKNGSLSGAPDKLQVVHRILDASDVLVRQLNDCTVDDLAEHDKSRLSGELTKTKEALEGFLNSLN